MTCYHGAFTLHYGGQNPLSGTHRGKAAALAALAEVDAPGQPKIACHRLHHGGTAPRRHSACGNLSAATAGRPFSNGCWFMPCTTACCRNAGSMTATRRRSIRSSPIENALRAFARRACSYRVCTCRQFSLRFGIGASNCAISAVCGALPEGQHVPWSKSRPVAIGTSPAKIISASGSCTLRWITRFSGRAP